MAQVYVESGEEPLAGDPVYRPSFAETTVVILATLATTTTIAAFGSADGYTTPGSEFGDDEEIRVGGTVRATDNANLTAGRVEIRVNGAVAGSVNLYGYDGALNYWMADLGVLAPGSYTVRATFQRLRI